MVIKVITRSERETEAAGEALGRTLAAGMCVALYGGMGAGKTAFVRGLARGAGYAGRVTSPTFAIVNEYDAKPPIFHFDMYRLGGADELFDIGWDDYLERDGVCVVEWSERVAEALPAGAVTVRINKTGENEREILIGGEAK